MIDPHHHFLDPLNNPSFQSFLLSLGAKTPYLPSQYSQDVIQPILKTHQIPIVGTIHVECIPDNGLLEVLWVKSMIESGQASYVKGIVASCDLANPLGVEKIEQELKDLVAVEYPLIQPSQSDSISDRRLVKGIRWILDSVGPYGDGNTATHVATKRFDSIDYLSLDNEGNEATVKRFEKGYALLEKYNLSFDLQCAPSQLMGAYALIQKYPSINVCLDHLGKPRTIIGKDVPETLNNFTVNEDELNVWRKGMKALSELPNVYVKISMLGYIIPGWIRSQDRENLLKGLVLEVVRLFGPSR